MMAGLLAVHWVVLRVETMADHLVVHLAVHWVVQMADQKVDWTGQKLVEWMVV